MELYYKKEHISCSYYSNSYTSVFKLVKCAKGETITRKYPNETFIVFLIRGKVVVSYDSEHTFEVNEGNAFLLPKSLDVKCLVLEETMVVLCSFTSDLKLCSRFSIQELNVFLPENSAGNFYSIKINDMISGYIQSLITAIEAGLGCKHFHSMKREELFIYLRAGYSKEELSLFFSPVLGEDIDFKDFVLTNYKKIGDVKEFADNANMSISTFNRRFKETFNDTAKNWLLARRAESIYKDVIMSDVPFTELSEKYSFSSPAYFARYCKKTFGKTAMELRRENKYKSFDAKV